jgi:para-nitrobenzyl esterase
LKKTEIIDTKLGKIQGYIYEGISIFKRIPFAEPPVGDLRLKNPLPKKPWNGILETVRFGPEAPQPYNINTPHPRPSQSEKDCLTLNIWTPASDDEKRPVMVWIHGGAHLYGSNSRAMYYGSNLVRRGNVVIVTINYRLGPFANLYLHGAQPNVGILDQVIALEWVRDNIGIFGGDPDNVTIFGESAGGTSVCTLMAMPKAKGLFKRVIAQSGAANPVGYNKSNLEDITKLLLNELNFKSDQLEEFQKVPWLDIIKATFRIIQKGTSRGGIGSFYPFVDRDTLPVHPLKAINNGFAKDVELIIGCNLEESKTNTNSYRNYTETDLENLPRRMLRAMKAAGESEDDLEHVINTYKISREENKLPSNPQDLFDAYNSDRAFRIPAIRFAEYQSKHQEKTYMYLFSWGLPNNLGSIHGLEIGFVFNRFLKTDVPTLPKKSEETMKLSENMMDSWISFAKTGNPNHEGIPYWPTYNLENRSTIIFDKEIKIWDDPLGKERQMWNKMKLLSHFSL